ncbi:MAG: hypothetical protein MZW92_76080 [Comamonadaceae bacterium]|nr:hypothetical protein [Comamonadaceae bacterium]
MISRRRWLQWAGPVRPRSRSRPPGRARRRRLRPSPTPGAAWCSRSMRGMRDTAARHRPRRARAPRCAGRCCRSSGIASCRPSYAAQAYDDHPLPIGHGQTISQPFIVALMTELARAQARRRVLEVGTGSGYQAAVLAELRARASTRSRSWRRSASAPRALLRAARLPQRRGAHRRRLPGLAGGARRSTRIVVTAAPDHVPQPLVDQLEARRPAW